MCLKTNQIEPTKIRKDIIVYVARIKKNGRIFSPFANKYKWKLNKLAQTEISKSRDTVTDGFNSFKNVENAIALADFMSLREGMYPNPHVRMAIIPSDSLVYIGKTSDICHRENIDNECGFVSNQLILGKKVYELKRTIQR